VHTDAQANRALGACVRCVRTHPLPGWGLAGRRRALQALQPLHLDIHALRAQHDGIVVLDSCAAGVLRAEVGRCTSVCDAHACV